MFYDTPQATKLSIAEREVGEVTILTLSGQILVDDGDLAIKKKVLELIARGRVQLLLDLGGVSHIDSAGFGTIASKAMLMRKQHGDLKLMHVTPRSQRLIAMMKLNGTFETFEDEEEAIRSFTEQRTGQLDN